MKMEKKTALLVNWIAIELLLSYWHKPMMNNDEDEEQVSNSKDQ